MTGTSGFRHEALLYKGDDEFVVGTAGFVRQGLTAGEPVMVAVAPPRTGLLRDELGDDAARVRFLDMELVGRNPARILPAWQAWVSEHAPAGRHFRGVGEPVWPGRSAAEIAECRQHEALLNTVFGGGPAWSLVCPYDVGGLGDDVIQGAYRTHPAMYEGERRLVTSDFPYPGLTHAAMFGDPLPAPPAERYETAFGPGDLGRIRDEVAERAAAAGLDADAVSRLVLAADELAGNSIVHGGGRGTLSLWREPGAVVCEVRDRGVIHDPLVGRRRPDLGRAGGGVGLWMTNKLCDLVQIRSAPETGTTVRVQIAL